MSRTALLSLFVLTGMAACGGDTVVGDLAVLEERGEVRILVGAGRRPPRLPRASHPYEYERRLAERFAQSLGLRARIVPVRSRDDLVSDLLEGRGDLIAANLTATPDRRERIAFTTPIARVREQVVTRLTDTLLTAPEDLTGRTIAVRRSSSFWATADSLRGVVPGLEIEEVSERLDTEEILYRVSRGEYDLTIADDNLVAQALPYLTELRVAFDVTPERVTGWGIRPGAPDLLAAADAFLADAALAADRPDRHTDDLDGIRERNVLRVITRNNATSYFVWRGALLGWEYDLAARFADELGVHLEIVVPPTRANLFQWLRDGYGDIVAAGLTVTDERAMRAAFSRPYQYVIETLGARADDDAVQQPEDLDGRRIAVRRRSAYWATAEALRARGIDVELVAVPESLETETVIGLVADGTYDLTIADSHILALELTWRDDVRGAFTVGDSVAHGWAVRSDNTALREAVNAFFDDTYRSAWWNIVHRRYFGEESRLSERLPARAAITGTISPYDSLIAAASDVHDFDWRLIAAQVYEESRFDPEAESWMGARGLLQLMPATAEAFGVEDPTDPAQSLRGGVRYLRRQYDLFEGDVAEADRMYFAFASYNAGYGHVTDAQLLARELGRDPRRWFGEVEAVMPLLSQRSYHRNTRYGYCRCHEPVNYVRRIQNRYGAYAEAVDEN